MVGNKDCGIDIKERVFKKTQADSCLERQGNIQIVTREQKSPWSNPHSYPTQFRCKMDPEKKRN